MTTSLLLQETKEFITRVQPLLTQRRLVISEEAQVLQIEVYSPETLFSSPKDALSLVIIDANNGSFRVLKSESGFVKTDPVFFNSYLELLVILVRWLHPVVEATTQLSFEEYMSVVLGTQVNDWSSMLIALLEVNGVKSGLTFDSESAKLEFYGYYIAVRPIELGKFRINVTGDVTYFVDLDDFFSCMFSLIRILDSLCSYHSKTLVPFASMVTDQPEDESDTVDVDDSDLDADLDIDVDIDDSSDDLSMEESLDLGEEDLGDIDEEVSEDEEDYSVDIDDFRDTLERE